MVHNHILAQALYYFFYNWIRPHMTLTARNGDKPTTSGDGGRIGKDTALLGVRTEETRRRNPGTPARTLPQAYTTEGTSEQCAATPSWYDALRSTRQASPATQQSTMR